MYLYIRISYTYTYESHFILYDDSKIIKTHSEHIIDMKDLEIVTKKFVEEYIDQIKKIYSTDIRFDISVLKNKNFKDIELIKIRHKKLPEMIKEYLFTQDILKSIGYNE